MLTLWKIYEFTRCCLFYYKLSYDKLKFNTDFCLIKFGGEIVEFFCKI